MIHTHDAIRSYMERNMTTPQPRFPHNSRLTDGFFILTDEGTAEEQAEHKRRHTPPVCYGFVQDQENEELRELLGQGPQTKNVWHSDVFEVGEHVQRPDGEIRKAQVQPKRKGRPPGNHNLRSTGKTAVEFSKEVSAHLAEEAMLAELL